MRRRSAKSKPAQQDTLSDDAFRQVGRDAGLPLDRLGEALASRLSTGDDPYAAPVAAAVPAVLAGADGATANDTAADGKEPNAELSPRGILEAALFVGGADQQPVTGQRVAELMRGVRAAEIDQLVIELNREYDRRNCPYRIASEGSGYRMILRGGYERLANQVRGRSRQARLSPAALEVLAAVAYHGPLTADDVAARRGRPSSHILTQLVRRQLIRLEYAKRRRALYSTTPRFLKLFGLASLDELPSGSTPEN